MATDEVEIRPIAGFPGYFVGPDGIVWSKRLTGPLRLAGGRSKMRPLSIYRRPYGARYCVVCMRALPCGKVSCHYVHRLVLEAFVSLCPEGMVACHNDGDTTNNNLSNLRWDTSSGNHQDKWKHGTMQNAYSDQVVRTVRALRAVDMKVLEVADIFGMHVGTVTGLTGKRRKFHPPWPTAQQKFLQATDLNCLKLLKTPQTQPEPVTVEDLLSACWEN